MDRESLSHLEGISEPLRLDGIVTSKIFPPEEIEILSPIANKPKAADK